MQTIHILIVTAKPEGLLNFPENRGKTKRKTVSEIINGIEFELYKTEKGNLSLKDINTSVRNLCISLAKNIKANDDELTLTFNDNSTKTLKY